MKNNNLKAEWHREEAKRHLKEADECDKEYDRLIKIDNDTNSIVNSYLESKPSNPGQFLRDKISKSEVKRWIAPKITKDPRIKPDLEYLLEYSGCPCCIIGAASPYCDLCGWDPYV